MTSPHSVTKIKDLPSTATTDLHSGAQSPLSIARPATVASPHQSSLVQHALSTFENGSNSSIDETLLYRADRLLQGLLSISEEGKQVNLALYKAFAITPAFTEMLEALKATGCKVTIILSMEEVEKQAEHLKLLAQCLGNAIECLQIRPAHNPDLDIPKLVYNFISQCTSLNSLDFSSCPTLPYYRTYPLIQAVGKRLQHLNFSGYKKLDKEGLSKLRSDRTAYISLSFAHCTQLAISDILEFLSSAANSLEHLDLSGLELNEAFINGLANLLEKRGDTSLQSLALSDCKGLSEKGLELLIAGCKKSLRAIDLAGCPIPASSILEQLREASLTKLNLRRCKDLTDSLCMTIRSQFSQLICVDLRDTAVTYAGILLLAQTCKKLQEVLYSEPANANCLEKASLPVLQHLISFKHVGMPANVAEKVTFLITQHRQSFSLRELRQLIRWTLAHELTEYFADLVSYFDHIPPFYTFEMNSEQALILNVNLTADLHAAAAQGKDPLDQLAAHLEFLYEKNPFRAPCKLVLYVGDTQYSSHWIQWRGWQRLAHHVTAFDGSGLALSTKILTGIASNFANLQILQLADIQPTISMLHLLGNACQALTDVTFDTCQFPDGFFTALATTFPSLQSLSVTNCTLNNKLRKELEELIKAGKQVTGDALILSPRDSSILLPQKTSRLSDSGNTALRRTFLNASKLRKSQPLKHFTIVEEGLLPPQQDIPIPLSNVPPAFKKRLRLGSPPLVPPSPLTLSTTLEKLNQVQGKESLALVDEISHMLNSTYARYVQVDLDASQVMITSDPTSSLFSLSKVDQQQLISVLLWLCRTKNTQAFLSIVVATFDEMNAYDLFNPLKPYLVEMKISTSFPIQSESWARFWGNCDALMTLTLQDCQLLSDNHLLVIRDNCFALSQLNVQQCIEITEVGRLCCMYRDTGSIQVQCDDAKYLGDPGKLESLQQFKALVDIAKEKHPHFIEYIIQHISIEASNLAPLIEFASVNQLTTLLQKCLNLFNRHYAGLVSFTLDPKKEQDQLIFFPSSSVVEDNNQIVELEESAALNPLKKCLKVLAENCSSLAVTLDQKALLPTSKVTINHLLPAIYSKITALMLRSTDYSFPNMKGLSYPHDEMLAIIQRCEGLRELTLQFLPLSGKQFIDLFRKYLPLVSLKIWNCPQIEPEHLNLVAPYLLQLQALSLCDLKGYTDSFFVTLAKAFRHLSRLDMRDFPNMTDASFSTPLPSTSKLRTVIIKGAAIEGRSPFSTLNQITELEISLCPNLTPRIFPTLAALPALTTLSVKNNPSLGDFATGPAVPKIQRSNSKKELAQPLSPKGSSLLARRTLAAEAKEALPDFRLERLTALDLSGCGGLKDDDVSLLTQNAPLLLYLDLSQCFGVTEKCLKSVLRNCLLLEKVITEHCDKIPAITASLLSSNKNLPNTWKIDKQSGITTHTLDVIISRYAAIRCQDLNNPNAPELQTLSISHCTVLTKEILVRIANAFPKIRSLTLINAPIQDTIDPLKTIFEFFNQLEYLHVEDLNSGTDDSDFAKFPRALNLKRLICKKTNYLTDSGLAHFCDKFPKLQKLSLKIVPNVSLKGLIQVVKTNPNIIQLSVDDPTLLLEAITHARLTPQAKLLENLIKSSEKKR